MNSIKSTLKGHSIMVVLLFGIFICFVCNFIRILSAIISSFIKSKNNTVVKYSLKDIKKTMGISEYQLTQNLPKELKSSLPSIEEIENELDEK